METDIVCLAYSQWLAMSPVARTETLPELAQRLDVRIEYLTALHNQPWWEAYMTSRHGDWMPGASKFDDAMALDILREEALIKRAPWALKMYINIRKLDFAKPSQYAEVPINKDDAIDLVAIEDEEWDRYYEQHRLNAAPPADLVDPEPDA